jgi:DNA-binding LytR/AlgR family response regulator
MKVDIQVDAGAVEPYAVIYTQHLTPEITALADKWRREGLACAPPYLIAYEGGQALLLRPQDVIRIYAENKQVYLQAIGGVYRLRMRLYEVEAAAFCPQFIRISQSEIVNFDYVQSLDISFSGTMAARLKNGDTVFVSRRYVPAIKQYLGL